MMLVKSSVGRWGKTNNVRGGGPERIRASLTGAEDSWGGVGDQQRHRMDRKWEKIFYVLTRCEKIHVYTGKGAQTARIGDPKLM
jgi:hypothetical protein